MFFNMKYNWLFIYLMFITPVLFFYMNSFYSMWFVMEFNLMIFLVLLRLNNKFILDKMMKYFLLNSFASMFFLFFISYNYLFYYYFFNYLINMSMFMKLGMFPFYVWFVDLMQEIDWMSCFLLSVWQKIIPMLLLMNFYDINLMVYSSFMGGFVSVLKIYKQILLKKIMAYSSINHMSWMFIAMVISFKVWMMYFLSYMVLNFTIMMFLKYYNIDLITQMFTYILSFNMKFFLMLIFMSLGGLPPFFGFMMKWLMVYFMTYYILWFYMIMMIFYSLFFLYYYIRIFFNCLLMNNVIFNINFKMYNYLKYKNFNFYIFMNVFLSVNLIIFFMWIFY